MAQQGSSRTSRVVPPPSWSRSLLLREGGVVASLSLYGALFDTYKLLVFSASIQFHKRNQGIYDKEEKFCFVLFFILSEK